MRLPVANVSYLALSVVLAAAMTALNCGGASSIPTPPVQPPGAPVGSSVAFSHVVLVVEENHSYGEVIGNSAMPYLNSLAQQYGLAAQYYADAHPSLPNYFMLTTGMIETLDDNFTGVVSDDNVVRELTNAGKTWKCYAESLPSVGYLGGDVYPYLRRHNPFSYLSDVQNSATQTANIVPFTQLATDLSANSLPQYAFIAPNALDDAHDGSLADADTWLSNNIAPVLANPAFQASGLLLIIFDEGDFTDLANGGGHVATVIISSQAKKNYVSQTTYQHQNTLQLTLTASGVTVLPGAAATAASMSEFFTGH